MSADPPPQSPDEQFVSEVFHELSQPLTALTCTLELCLCQDETVEELKASIATALEGAERLRSRLSLVRAMSDAANPGDAAAASDVREVLDEVKELLGPALASSGQQLAMGGPRERIVVKAERNRLFRALVYFFEYLVRHGNTGSVTHIDLREVDGNAAIVIHSQSALPAMAGSRAKATPYSCEIEIARRTFCAAGGDLQMVSGDWQQSVWSATLPLASNISVSTLPHVSSEAPNS